jgi:hypothetical protein
VSDYRTRILEQYLEALDVVTPQPLLSKQNREQLLSAHTLSGSRGFDLLCTSMVVKFAAEETLEKAMLLEREIQELRALVVWDRSYGHVATGIMY